MYVLGVTGPSGAGKGTVAKILEECGFYHVDTDIISREIIPEVIDILVEAFGKDIIDENNELQRKILAKKAFSSEENTKKLNMIMHKKIMERVEKIISECEQAGYAAVCVDGAALFEAGAQSICCSVLAVLAPIEERLERVILRDKITKDQALIRFKGQKNDEFFIENADFYIINTDKEKLKTEILKLCGRLLK